MRIAENGKRNAGNGKRERECRREGYRNARRVTVNPRPPQDVANEAERYYPQPTLDPNARPQIQPKPTSSTKAKPERT
ncbi:hypothetical protein FA15DRAFT_268008 [Coprinopsis marcescibilis]|uniref:Uncharacterized protein n=1 Tax=Coprinopsis marcescibilis TaxID=230819 RepID=A0A5C3KDS3_COPMA|nr:hypothetical protein FA15DRAFT_268008 [Coprinopsis marcescibilis]